MENSRYVKPVVKQLVRPVTKEVDPVRQAGDRRATEAASLERERALGTKKLEPTKALTPKVDLVRQAGDRRATEAPK